MKIKIYSKHIVFRDIVNSLYHSIKSFNYKVSITDKITNNDDLFILIGAAEFCDTVPKNYIVYQFEQSNVTFNNKKDIWFSDKYLHLIKNSNYVWDYSESNIKYLNDKFNIENIIYVPLRYCQILDNFPKIKESSKDIDILFMGSINDRRKKILDKLGEKYNVHIAQNNLWNDERDQLVSRSKIVLNVQFYENGILELARLSYLLSGGAFVISESGREDKLVQVMKEYMILGNYNSLELLVKTYLNNDIERIKKRTEFRESWKKTDFNKSIPLECFKGCEMGQDKKKGKIKYYMPINIKSIKFEVSPEGCCRLLLPDISNRDLPEVSIITPTKNRKLFFKLAIENFTNFIYPQDKLEWIICDNGNEDLNDILPNDKRIKYIKLGDKEAFPIGYMRNKCIENSTKNIICYMDDDDVYRPESILARVKSLIKYKSDGVECVGCTQVGCFNIVNGQSVIGTNSTMFLSEASIAHTRQFWLDRKYDNNDKCGEYKHFLLFRQQHIRSIPYQFIITAINHKSNTTGEMRNFTNYSEWMEKNSNNQNFSFFEMFDENIKLIIYKIISELQLSITKN